jgi:hypothetical protein
MTALFEPSENPTADNSQHDSACSVAGCNFDEESIKTNVPPVSGVYRLYRTKHVLIGESENIQEALLQRVRENRLHFGMCRPREFVFEVCSPELRAHRAQELIAKYRPLFPFRFAWSRFWSARKSQSVSNAEETPPVQLDNPSPSRAANQTDNEERLYVATDHFIIAALAFVAVAIGFLGFVIESRIEPGNILKVPVNPERAPQALSERVARFFGRQKEGPTAQMQREARADTWAVQVNAFPNKSSADVSATKLKTKGYDAFIVVSETKGQTWYRVRVGPFDSRVRAETMRNILDSREGFRDAFLASNATEDSY